MVDRRRDVFKGDGTERRTYEILLLFPLSYIYLENDLNQS